MNLKAFIPNLFTTANLCCGILAIEASLNFDWPQVALLIILANVFDFLDGFMARLLKAGSAVGAQLDSLADMVTFGVAPGIICWKWLGLINNSGFNWLPYVAFAIPIFAAFRLAKFNVDDRQTTHFIGLPTPANDLLIMSLPIIGSGLFADWGIFSAEVGLIFQSVFISSTTLALLILLLSLLMVAELPLFALKFKDFNFINNKTRYTFLLISLVLLVSFAFMAIPIIILLYLVISIIQHTIFKQL